MRLQSESKPNLVECGGLWIVLKSFVVHAFWLIFLGLDVFVCSLNLAVGRIQLCVDRNVRSFATLKIVLYWIVWQCVVKWQCHSVTVEVQMRCMELVILDMRLCVVSSQNIIGLRND
ncbi:hypothetical protein KC19_12G111000 [Ceratodon purpureus]|uniref:Transmembrane protein n=1 Tax=Ceratodon purpureus TaxID=3225 RepID=A0A8T0G6Y8_CERPU|nr:hypothetical protein KC19_12G111000 [Ceratodon purpureus]